MVPPAPWAGLYYVGRILMAGALQLVDITGVGDTFSVFRKTMPKDIGDENDIHFFADGTNGF